MLRLLKIPFIIIAAIVVTSLSIDAADTLSGVRGTLLGQLAGTSAVGGCPEGMVPVSSESEMSCVDMYESSPSDACPSQDPTNQFDTEKNIEASTCAAVSKSDAKPWRYVTRDQAQALCLRSGKRLPTNAEWHRLALGTNDNEGICNTNTNDVTKTGSQASCISATGVFDAVGNAWEWTSEDAVNGSLNNRPLPMTGYVNAADSAGVAFESSEVPNDTYGGDYIWTSSDTIYAIMRGGFFGSGNDAGVYTLHAQVQVDMRGNAIGFRCVQ